MKPGFCTERLLESCLEFSKEAKSKLTVYLINNEKWKTDTIVQTTRDFVDLQKTITLSSRDQSVPQRPVNPKPTGRSDPKKGDKTEGHLKPRQDFSRSQSSQQRPRGDGETNKGAMSLSFTSRGSGSSGSNSKFYGDDSKGKKNSDRSQDHALVSGFCSNFRQRGCQRVDQLAKLHSVTLRYLVLLP